MSDNKIIRNGKAYDSADVKVQINGVPIELEKINYGNNQEHKLNYTLGANPTSFSQGKIEPYASIRIPMHFVTPLETASGGLLKIKPFLITIEFVNEYNLIVVDTVLAKFQTEGRDVTGEMGLAMDYDLFAMDVNLNVAA